jgi:hypothetical protein
MACLIALIAVAGDVNQTDPVAMPTFMSKNTPGTTVSYPTSN